MYNSFNLLKKLFFFSFVKGSTQVVVKMFGNGMKLKTNCLQNGS